MLVHTKNMIIVQKIVITYKTRLYHYTPIEQDTNHHCNNTKHNYNITKQRN